MEDKWYAETVARTAALTIENGAKAVNDRIKQAKVDRNKDKTIIELEEIITDLQNDRSELLSIAQIYEEEFVDQKITDEDLHKIKEELIPTIKEFITLYEEYEMNNSGNFNAEEINQVVDMLAPFLSKEMLSMLQTIGFNYKRAIGEPLTKLVSSMILSNVNINNNPES